MADNTKVGEFRSQKLTESIETILDTFSGGDGGASFVLLCQLVRELDDRFLDHDDMDAKKATDVVIQFARLIKIAQRVGGVK